MEKILRPLSPLSSFDAKSLRRVYHPSGKRSGMETYFKALDEIEDAIENLPFTDAERLVFSVYIAQMRRALTSWDAGKAEPVT